MNNELIWINWLSWLARQIKASLSMCIFVHLYFSSIFMLIVAKNWSYRWKQQLSMEETNKKF